MKIHKYWVDSFLQVDKLLHLLRRPVLLLLLLRACLVGLQCIYYGVPPQVPPSFSHAHSHACSASHAARCRFSSFFFDRRYSRTYSRVYMWPDGLQKSRLSVIVRCVGRGAAHVATGSTAGASERRQYPNGTCASLPSRFFSDPCQPSWYEPNCEPYPPFCACISESVCVCWGSPTYVVEVAPSKP